MKQPQCFYRVLLIGCLSSHHALTGSDEHLPLLKSVTNALAADIDASPVGLLDDYPGQCFPCDVAGAIAMIENAAPAFGEVRHAWARQAFARMMESFPDGLPSYMAVAATGKSQGPSRGCTNGFFFTYSVQLAPDRSAQWYRKYTENFWQENSFLAGWREFSKNREAL